MNAIATFTRPDRIRFFVVVSWIASNPRSIFKHCAAVAAIVAASVLPVQAIDLNGGDLNAGDLMISDQKLRATVPTARVAAGYMTVTNTGTGQDRLLGAQADFAGKVEVHEMNVADGVMTMRSLPEGLIVPAGETVVLEPGGNHLMFMKLREQMNEGETRTVVLEFERAGKVAVLFPVGSLGGSHENPGDHSHSGHGSD